VEGPSNADIKRLRKQADSLAISIRKQRASRARLAPTYRLVDRDTGHVIHKDVLLEDLAAHLWMLRYRQHATVIPVRFSAEPDQPMSGTPSPAPDGAIVSLGSFGRAKVLDRWVPALYLLGIAGAEAATRLTSEDLGLLLYVGIVIVGLNQAAVTPVRVRTLLLAVALVGVERLLVFSAPVGALGPSLARIAVSVATVVGIAFVARLARYSRRDLGLFVNGRVAAVSLALALPSVALGFLVSDALQPLPLDGDQGVAAALATLTVLAFTTGLVEEALFRGLLQRAASECLGRLPGILYVALLYTLIASALWNAVGIGFVAIVSFGLAALTASTRSVVPAATAHAGLNIGLLLSTTTFAASVGLR
jgi:membrane protease YdiL (CAAX protease family)